MFRRVSISGKTRGINMSVKWYTIQMKILQRITLTMKITNIKSVILILLFASGAQLLLAQEDSTKMEDKSGQATFRVPYYESSFTNSTAPVQIIDGESMESVPGTDVRLALPGRIANSVVTQNYNLLGSQAGMLIRGSNYLVLIDGVPRPLSDISAYEIESINVIKGFSGTAMFGADASEGILYVTTKKGIPGKNRISLEVDQGMSFVQQNYLPRWLNSYDYATLYNEASRNDGLTEPYSAEALEAYQSGDSPIRYPDENLYDQIFNDRMNYSRVNLNFTGGDKKTRYFINLGYQTEGNGLYNIGEFNTNDLRLRTNLDVALSDIIDLSVGAFGSINLAKYSNAEDEVWDVLSSYPSNAYPVEIAPDTFGTNQAYPINPVGDLTEYLSTNEINRTGRFNVKLSIDLSSLLPGLKMDHMLAYDMTSFVRLSERVNKTYPLFEPVFNDEDATPDSLIQYGLFDPSAGVSITGNTYDGRFYQYSQLAYEKQFGMHYVDAGIVNSFRINNYRLDNASQQDIKNQDLSFRLHYSFNNKYHFDFIETYSGIMNVPAENRFKGFPTVGAAWVISEESFLESATWLNFMKVRGSYGKLGIFNSSDLFIHSSYWDQSGWTNFNNWSENSTLRFQGTRRIQIGNEGIAWGEMTEMNVGTDVSILRDRFSVSFDYFNRTSEGLVLTSPIPSIIGTQNYSDNLGSNQKTGFDASFTARVISGNDFDLALQVNAGHYVTTVLVNNELDVPYEWMSRVNRPTDAIYGLVADGLIGNDQPADAPAPLFGSVNPGNINYEDLNDDGFIQDEIDEEMIGNYSPRYNFGLSLSLRYKKVSLRVNGYGLAGYKINTLNNPYFYAYGNAKYSAYVMENRWTEENSDVSAGHPRLTTGSNNNDRRTSSYWLIDGGFFRIKNAELAYTFKLGNNGADHRVRIFARGTNLFTISKIKDLDPEDLSYGVSTYPSMRTYSMGLSVTFN